MTERVVITGTGLVSALGNSSAAAWQSLLAGNSGVRPIEGFTAHSFPCAVAAEVAAPEAADPESNVKFARILDRPFAMLLSATREALAEARFALDSLPGEEIGFFLGMGMFDYEVEDFLAAVRAATDADGRLDYDRFYADGYRNIHPLWPLAMLNNIVFCQVAAMLDIRGENSVFSPHADSALQAVAEGVRVLRDGSARVVLAGGVSEKVTPCSLARAHLTDILSRGGDAVRPLCRPMSALRSGTVLGEGCGMTVLEGWEAAQARNASCLAEILGCAVGCDVDPQGSVPRARTIARVMREALAHAGLEARAVDVVIAHGDGALRGDGEEIDAIHEVFADHVESLRVFSAKGALGHTLAAAPAVDLVLAVRMLESGLVPQTCHAAPLDPRIRFQVGGDGPVAAHPRRILINGLSHEGQCASLIVGAAT